MSFRTFQDSRGHEWQAFDVIPRLDERRNYDRRISGEIDGDADERRDADRRLTVGGNAAIAGTRGWLCFESGKQRRRLSPIPANWFGASDEELEAYCRTARPVRQAARAEHLADERR